MIILVKNKIRKNTLSELKLNASLEILSLFSSLAFSKKGAYEFNIIKFFHYNLNKITIDSKAYNFLDWNEI